MERIIYYFLIGILLFELNGCKKKQECEDTKLEIQDLSGDWFKGIIKTSNLYLYSSKGRSESMEVEYTNEFITLKEDGCNSVQGEVRKVSYSSSLYGRTYNCKIIQHESSSLITVYRWEGYDNPKRCEIDPNKKTTFMWVNYEDYGVTPQVEKPLLLIDSIVINKRVFKNTYKIDFGLPEQSIDGKTKVIYLNPEYGIIKFERFDGEEWALF